LLAAQGGTAPGCPGAIQHSCDVFFYETSRALGIDKIEEAARKLGLGSLTGIELPGEHSGLIPSRAWKQKTYKQVWQQGDTLSVASARVMSRRRPCSSASRRRASPAASGVAPAGAFGGRRGHAAAEPRRWMSSAKRLAIVREGMFKVMNEPGGTGYSWRILEPGFEMAGKTAPHRCASTPRKSMPAA
jgi:penicillin-binding protein 2